MTRILVMGLDGATLDLIEPWARDGSLPNFAKLIDECQGGELPSTVPPMTPPAWTTFATGATPGSHGIFDWTHRSPSSYEISPLSAASIKVPTMWDYLSTRDRTSLVINVPMTYPPKPINGVMVAGMPAPRFDSSLVSPSDTFAILQESAPNYDVYPDPGQGYSRQGVDAFIERLHGAAEARMLAWRALRKRDDFDFEMVTFNGTDTAHHALWHLMDPNHPQYEENAPEHQKNAIRDYYVLIDRYLGELMDVARSEGRSLLVMSDHGGGPLLGLIHINNWLLKEGLLHLRKSFASRIRHATYRAGFTPMSVYNVLVRVGFGKLKSGVVRGKGRSLLTSLFLSFKDVDWASTRAYSAGNVGQIYLNVEGREPLGVVSRSDHERTRDEIRTRLEQWEHLGEKVVEAVYYPEEIWSGEQLDNAPDILFVPRGLEYFGFGEFEFGSNKVFQALQRGISGTHRMNGIGLWWGPGIASARSDGPQQLQDLAPTIVHLLGEPVPTSMQGSVLTSFLEESRPVQSIAIDADGTSDELTFSDEEEALIEERLRGLGYV